MNNNYRNEFYKNEVPIFQNLNNEEFLETMERLAKIENILQNLVIKNVIKQKLRIYRKEYILNFYFDVRFNMLIKKVYRRQNMEIKIYE